MISVFVYDDNRSRVDSLVMLLEMNASTTCVGSAFNCAHVLKDMEQYKPQIVLMDIEMPLANGFEGLKSIKKNFTHIKVVMQTAFNDADKIFEALRLGADGYILKTASVQSVLQSIEEVYNGGAYMTPSIALKVMNYFQKPTAMDTAFDQLTQKENEVLMLLAEGLSYKLIADKMNITAGTVNNHLKKVYEKLQVHSAGEAISMFHKSGKI